MKIWFLLAFGGWVVGMTAMGQDVAALRKERDVRVEKGRWREALEAALKSTEKGAMPIRDIAAAAGG